METTFDKFESVTTISFRGVHGTNDKQGIDESPKSITSQGVVILVPGVTSLLIIRHRHIARR